MAQMSGRILTSAIVVWLLGAAAARADFTNWSYAWGDSPVAVTANGGGESGTINFTLPQPSAVNSPISPVALSSTTSTSGTDTYTADSYSLSFTITDNTANQSKVLTLSGQFDGTVSQSLTNLTNTFTNGSNSQTFDFFGHHYVVNFGYTAPPNPAATSGWAASLTASVTVTTPVTDPPAAPEPTSLLLAGLALPALGLTGWKRRVRKAAVSA